MRSGASVGGLENGGLESSENPFTSMPGRVPALPHLNLPTWFSGRVGLESLTEVS